MFNVTGGSSDGHDDGTNVHTSRLTVWLTVGLSHTLLKSIGSSAGKHLVDSDNVPWVNSGSHVESVLTGLVLHVLVASNTSGFKSF